MPMPYEVNEGNIQGGPRGVAGAGAVEERVEIVWNLLDCGIDRVLLQQVDLDVLLHRDSNFISIEGVDLCPQFDQKPCRRLCYSGGCAGDNHSLALVTE